MYYFHISSQKLPILFWGQCNNHYKYTSTNVHASNSAAASLMNRESLTSSLLQHSSAKIFVNSHKITKFFCTRWKPSKLNPIAVCCPPLRITPCNLELIGLHYCLLMCAFIKVLDENTHSTTNSICFSWPVIRCKASTIRKQGCLIVIFILKPRFW